LGEKDSGKKKDDRNAEPLPMTALVEGSDINYRLRGGSSKKRARLAREKRVLNKGLLPGEVAVP